MTSSQKPGPWLPWIALATACGLGATRWMLPEFSAEQPGQSAFWDAAGVLLALLLAWASRTSRAPGPVRPRAGLRASGGGAMLYGATVVPGLFARWITGSTGESSSAPSSTNLTLALALAPVVVAVAEAATEAEPGLELPGRLWPGLAALGGLLLVLPQPSVEGLSAWGALAAVPLLAGLGAVLIVPGNGAQPWGVVSGRLAYSLTGALAVALAQGVLHRGFSSGSGLGSTGDWRSGFLHAGWSAACLHASWYALLRLGAMRWSASFTLVPLLLLLEGLVFARATPSWRAAAGLLLLALAAARLLMKSGGPVDMPARDRG